MDRELRRPPHEWGDTSEVFSMQEYLDNVSELLNSLPLGFPNRELIRSHIQEARRLLPRVDDSLPERRS